MAFSLQIADFDSLPVAEQVRLVTDLWDRIVALPERVAISSEQMAEIKRRLAEHDADPDTAIPWEVLADELLEVP